MQPDEHAQTRASNFTPPTSRDALLTRVQTAQALTALGYPVRPATLATKAVRGSGPPYRKFGNRPLYVWGQALDWAQGRMTAPRHHSSQADAQRQSANGTT